MRVQLIVLSLKDSFISESGNEIKIELNFYFHTSWMRVQLIIILTLKDPLISESCYEIKIELNFYFHFGRDWDVKG